MSNVISLNNYKEEQIDQEIEVLRDIFSEKDFERISRIYKGKAEKDDRLAISNQLIKIKFAIRNTLKENERLREYISNSEKLIEQEVFSDKFKELIENDIEEMKRIIKDNKELIVYCGKQLVQIYFPLIQVYFTKDEIIQLISGVHTEIKDLDENISKYKNRSETLVEYYVFGHAEYRWRKGRYKDFIDCPSWEMPLFTAMSEYIISELTTNPKLKQKGHEFLEEHFADAMVHVKQDSEGNVISAEKVYQELTARELIMNYEGRFINELKREFTFGDDTTYRIKRLDDVTYAVVDGDNKEIEKIFKKIN